MAWILLWSSAVRVHDSQAYRKMDVTRERISRILELIEILLSTQTGFSLVNAAVVCAILDSCLDYSHWYILWCCTDFSQCYILLCYIALTIATDTIILLRCLDYSPCYILSYRCDYSQCCTLLYCLDDSPLKKSVILPSLQQPIRPTIQRTCGTPNNNNNNVHL